MFSSLVAEPAPSNMGTSMGKSCPSQPARCGGVSRLMVTPRVSGLERSQEKSLEQHFPEPVCSSTSSAPFSCLPSPVTASGAVSRPSPFNGNGSRHNGSPPLTKPKPFLTLPGRSHSIYNINNRYEYFYHIHFFKWMVLCFYKCDSLFILLSPLFSGAAPQSNLPHLLQLLHLPHPPCGPRLPPPGAQHPQGPSDPHPEPALGTCSHPPLACLPLHLCSKVLLTQLQQVQWTGMLLFSALTV